MNKIGTEAGGNPTLVPSSLWAVIGVIGLFLLII